MQAFVIISNVGIKINAECECKGLTKENVMKDLFGIQVTVNVNVINYVK